MKRPLKALLAAILPVTLAFSALMSACAASHTHTLTPVAEKKATCTEAGNIAYWFCDDCDKYFSDAEAKNEITQSQTVVAATGHKWSELWTGNAKGHWHECDVCHESDSVVAHADANTDGVCDVCGYTMQSQEPEEPDPTPEDPIAVTEVKLDKTTAKVEEGKTVTLTATVTPENATDKAVTWTSSDSTIATVAGGVVTGVKAGTVTITATAGGKTATCTVEVTAAATDPGTDPEPEPDPTVSVTGVTLDKATVTLDINQSITLAATVAPENATNKAVTWTSDKTDIATVDASGKVTAVAAGTANITVTTQDGGKTATCVVTVNPATEPEDPTVTYEDVTSYLDIDAVKAAAGGEGVKLSADYTMGRFTVSEGAYCDTTGGIEGTVINTQKKDIIFTLTGRTNSIKLDLKGASSSVITLVDSTGKVIKDWGTVTSAILNQEVKGLSAGVYTLKTDGSARIGNISVTEELPASEPNGITVAGGVIDFMMGDAFRTDGLSVLLNYENGRTDILSSSQYKIDSSKFDSTKEGICEITVSYTPAGAAAPFTATYKVNVFEITEIELFDFSLDSDRITHNLQKVFLKGGEFNHDNLAVQGTGTIPKAGEDGSDLTKTFVISSDDLTFSSHTLDSVGKQTVTVTLNAERGTAPAETYEINVVENVFNKQLGTYAVNVDAAGTVSVSNGSVTFTSINDALKYLEITGVPATAKKVINVAAGTYNEKVEVNMPNVSIIGAGAETTVLWYDALNGVLDPSGTTTYSTDGSATISVRESATGFYAENITFKNYWNTQALYEQSKELAGSGTQAVAALVQADMAKFVNVYFTSYQDTLYAQVGRQYYENCYIEGRTDYVFGYNATAYFTNTELHTILGDSEKNGGYVVSTKGFDEGIGKDDIEYGYIFNNCKFTADEGVTPGTVSLARGWGDNMRMVVMNSDISGAYSKEAYGDTTSEKNDRYGKMNADPVAANLIEAGNKGDGAISESLEGTCTVITVGEAAKYADFATIFGTTNGKVTYAEAWVPVTQGETVAVTGVTLDKETLELTVGEGTATLVATIAPEGATESGLVWSTSDEKVATVDENGVVTPVGEGEATITVVTVDGNFSDTCKVTVKLPAGATITSESYLVKADSGMTDGSEIEANTVLIDSQAVTIVSENQLIYNTPVGADGKGGSYPTINGVQPEAAYKTYMGEKGDTANGETTGNFKFTAKGDMTIKVYMTFANNSYNSHRQGAVFNYSVAGGEVKTVTGGKRDSIVIIEATLLAGQTLSINVTNSTGNTGRVYFFGYDVTPLTQA